MFATTFYQLPIGARFEFRGRRYEKLALSMARDEQLYGNIFLAETEVVAEAPPAGTPHDPDFSWVSRTPPPVRKHWTEHLSPAPGQRPGASR